MKDGKKISVNSKSFVCLFFLFIFLIVFSIGRPRFGFNWLLIIIQQVKKIPSYNTKLKDSPKSLFIPKNDKYQFMIDPDFYCADLIFAGLYNKEFCYIDDTLYYIKYIFVNNKLKMLEFELI
jgi:hypothetical protein